MSDSRTMQRRSDLVPVPPCLAGADRVLFFGGSFDPPHAGHAGLPFEVAARWAGAPAWVVFVPAARSPHKAAAPIPDRHRVEMLRIGLRGRKRWWIWEQELADAGQHPGEPSYWADTWAIAGRAFASRDRAFLIGTDQALAMHRWHRYTEFWRDALVMRRGDQPVADFRDALAATGAWSDDDIAHWVSRLIEAPRTDASSTAIRAALADPDQRKTPIEGLDRGVQKYILDRGLYAMA